MPKRLQRKRTKGWKAPPGARYVGRPSRWGNPFKIGVDGTAEECVRKYVEMLIPYKHGGSMADFLLSEANIEAIRLDLQGKDLLCFCPLHQPCHADVLLSLANDGMNISGPAPEWDGVCRDPNKDCMNCIYRKWCDGADWLLKTGSI